MDISASHQEFLSQSRIPLRISCILPNGFPLVVSLWYLFEDNKLYCASGKDSKLIKYLNNNSSVGFEIAGDIPPYCGLRGYGTVDLSEDTGNKMIERLYLKYFKNEGSQLYNFLTDENREEIVITITPEQIFDWNFSDRMQDSIYREKTPICP